AAQRDHQIENAGGDIFQLQLGIEIFRRQTKRRCERFFVELCGTERGVLLRHGDALGAAILETDFDGKDSRAGLLQNVHAAFLRGHHAQLRQQEPSTDDRMAGQLQLFTRRENAQARQCLIFGGLLNEDGFRKIHFARNGEHGVIGETIAVGNNRERIAFKARGGEHVKGVEAAFHGDLSSTRASCWASQMRSSCATVLSLMILPVFRVDLGSIRTMWTSSSAAGQCSTPLGTITNSPSRTMASWSRNFMRSVPLTTRNSSSSTSW